MSLRFLLCQLDQVQNALPGTFALGISENLLDRDDALLERAKRVSQEAAVQFVVALYKNGRRFVVGYMQLVYLTLRKYWKRVDFNLPLQNMLHESNMSDEQNQKQLQQQRVGDADLHKLFVEN